VVPKKRIMGKIVGIIPARWGATRFPGKALALVADKPLIQHVWERCRLAERLARVIVATDDRRIAEVALAFGAEVAMTSPAHQSGTDRVAEVAADLPKNVSHILNIQGDEPTISPALIDRLAAELRRHRRLKMVTAANALRDFEQVRDPNCVKVALAKNGDALYFSRSVIPHSFGSDLPGTPLTYYRHQGIYGYERRFLARFVRWKPSDYERIEKLEQLRALHHGVPIRVLVTEHESRGVDSPADVAEVEAQLAAEGLPAS
jgi:3-deoxy-manno-octulosonate cytidylyltransferase (CMP-KDO synthetase)